MHTEERALALINAFYGAAVDEELWPDALSQFSQFFGSVGAVMHALTDDYSLLHVSGNLREGAGDYTGYWHQEDAMIHQVRDSKIKSGFIIDKRILPAEHFAKSGFYQDFLADLDIGSISTIKLAPLAGASFLFSLQNPIGVDPISEENKLFVLVAEHLSRAASTATLIRNLRAERDTLLAGYDRFLCAAAIVTTDGMVLSSNAAMQTNANGVKMKKGRLVALTAADQRRLDGLIRSASERLTPVQSSMVIRSETGNPIVIKAVPISADQIEKGSLAVERRDAVLILVLDPMARPLDHDHQVLQSLGLTRAQARVAYRLGCGMPPAEIAEQLGVTDNTIRTTIKMIYDKLGINRQADLVGIVLRALSLA